MTCEITAKEMTLATMPGHARYGFFDTFPQQRRQYIGRSLEMRVLASTLNVDYIPCLHTESTLRKQTRITYCLIRCSVMRCWSI